MAIPKVSIITISYNAEQYIERTMQSVFEQTYPNIEYVIIDGQSKDSTLDIIERYKDQIAIFVSEPDKNLYDAMNKAIRRATGDYIWFMNAGDRIAGPDVLTKAMTGKEDFIYGKTLRVEENGTEHPWHKPHPSDQSLSWKSFGKGMVVCHQSMIVRRSLVPEYDLRWTHVADIDWCIRTMKNVKTVRDTGELMCWFLEGGFSTQTHRASLQERFAVQRAHFGLLGALGLQFKIVWDRVAKN